jgi:hypothetical protein
MGNLLRTVLAVTLISFCQYGHAADDPKEESPAVKMLESGRKTKRLEGSSLKIARPILKKTPVSVLLDDIEMMMICPLEKEKDDFTYQAEKLLKGYMMVREIDDELSHIFIYIDNPVGERFSELILYTTSPEANIMLFEGDFTLEALKKVGDLSIEDRKQRIRARHK